MIEIEHISINTKVCILSSHSAMPRQGHLEAAFNIMGYLKLRHNTILVVDPSYLVIDHSSFWECGWKDFYEVTVEVFLPNAYHPRGKKVYLCMFVYSDPPGNKQSRRTRTGFMIDINMSQIFLYSKNQTTKELVQSLLP